MPESKPEIIEASASRLPEGGAPSRKSLPGAGKNPDAGLPYENPRRIISQGMWIIGIFFGLFGLWACIGHIHGAVVAQGKIKIENERKIVQHLEGGIVDEILVHEGEEVKAGQPLIVLSSVSVDANTNMQKKQVLDLEARRARLQTEKGNTAKIEWPGETLNLARELKGMDVIENEEKIFAARRQTLQTQIKLFQSQLAQLKEQIASFEAQLKAESRIISTLNEELASKRKLLKEHYLDKTQILELERSLAAHEGSRSRYRQNIAEAKQKIGEINLRVVNVLGEFQQEAITELGNVENELIQARERVRPTVDAKERLQITAPVAGKVVDLKVHTRGSVIQGGQTLMDIVPDNQPMIVETQIPLHKITEVYPGQEASIQLDAFDTRFQPRLPGKVTYISADRIEEGNDAYYLCFVEVNPNALAESDLYISPGMPATVYIMTTEKTIIFYMLEPIIKSWDRSLRD